MDVKASVICSCRVCSQENVWDFLSVLNVNDVQRDVCLLFTYVHVRLLSGRASAERFHLQTPSGLQSYPRNSNDCQDEEV